MPWIVRYEVFLMPKTATNNNGHIKCKISYHANFLVSKIIWNYYIRGKLHFAFIMNTSNFDPIY